MCFDLKRSVIMKVIYDCSVPLHPIMEDSNGATGHCAGVGPFSDN